MVVQGYSASAQTQYALDGLRWVADYFVKCHHSDVAYTGQVSVQTRSQGRMNCMFLQLLGDPVTPQGCSARMLPA